MGAWVTRLHSTSYLRWYTKRPD